MKKLFVLGIVVTMVLGLFSSSSYGAEEKAEKKMDIDALIAAHTKALGGKKALAKVKNIERSGISYIEGDFGEIEGTVKEALVVGKKFYRALKLAGGGETTAWNGKTGWKESSESGDSEVEGDELELLKASAGVSTILTLWEGHGAKELKVMADEKLDGELHHVVQMESSDAKFYVNKSTYMLAAMKFKPEEGQPSEMDVRISFEDYKERDGVQLPDAVILDIAGGAFTLGYEYSVTKINGEIDDSLFEKP
jgi:hypothetical protein